ncbi:TPA: hypothetical protein SLF17_003094 [Serratia marcescens]|nr:hypothetical protein [Serratia marcescens]
MDRLILRRVNRAERLSVLNLPSDKSWLVWWYGPLRKSKKYGKQPKVAIVFREVYVDGALSNSYCEQKCSLTDLAFLKIGSIWKNSICIAESIMDEEIFDVDFSYLNNGWSINSFYNAHQERSPLPYDLSNYALKNSHDKNWLLEFACYQRGRVIIHPLEFFYRCFGSSDELKRTLLTYSWGDVCNRLFSEAWREGSKTLYVKLRKRMNNKDAAFVSFFALEPFTQKLIKKLQSQLEANGGAETYIKIAPWFKGKAKIRVKGRWLDGGESFLGLSVTGVSLPDGYTINIDRDNSNRVNEKADDGSPKAWDNVATRRVKSLDDAFNVDNTFDPDSGASSLETEVSPFDILGDNCRVVPLRKEKAMTISGSKTKNGKHSSYSVNETSGVEDDIGYLSTRSELKDTVLYLESNGIVRDMWNAMLYLKENNPERIKSLEWYTPENSFSNTQSPELVAIPEFENDETQIEGGKISKTILNWPYLDVIKKRDVRGFLISRMVIDDNVIYFMEIQRRVQNENDVDTSSESEKFKGLVFTVNVEADIYQWVSLLAHELRFVKGIVQKMVGKCPGMAMTYKHSPAKNEPIACYSALLNALSKIGVIF